MAKLEPSTSTILELLKVAGPIAFTGTDIRIEIQTAIEGALAPISIAPRLTPSRLRANFDLGSHPQIVVKVESDSLEVISDGISISDRRKIALLVSERILAGNRFPQVEFTSTLVSIQTERPPFFVAVAGTLSINGVKKDVDLIFKHQNNALLSQVKLTQSDFKIIPISGMMGALRCKDELSLDINVSLKKLESHLNDDTSF